MKNYKKEHFYEVKDKIIDNLSILQENIEEFTDEGMLDPGSVLYNQTIDLIEWLKPEILNVSKFTPRPGTKAKTMEQVNSKVIKMRSSALTELFRQSLGNINSKWKNWEGEVLVLHKGHKNNQKFGRNFAYKNVFIDNFSGDYGSFVKVRITDTDGFNLFAERI